MRKRIREIVCTLFALAALAGSFALAAETSGDGSAAPASPAGGDVPRLMESDPSSDSREQTEPADLKVEKAEVTPWRMLWMHEIFNTPEHLEKVGGMLPRTVRITLHDGQEISASVSGTWTRDPDNARWLNTVDPAVLPEGASDPDGILDSVEVFWGFKQDLVGWLDVYPDDDHEKFQGCEGMFSIDFPGPNNKAELWQIPQDGSPAVLRCDQDSGFKLVREDSHGGRWRGAIHQVPAWSDADTGEWFCLYYVYDGWSQAAYLSAPCNVSLLSYTIRFRPGCGTMEGPLEVQTVCPDGVCHLPAVPPDPVRPGWRFTGWYTSSIGGEPFPLSTDTVISGHMTLYAHWAPESGVQPAVSAEKALQVKQVPGVAEVPNNTWDSTFVSRNHVVEWAMPIRSNIFRNPDGSFTTVDRMADRIPIEGEPVEQGYMTVSHWDRDFQKTGEQRIPLELPLYGGFYHGENANYFVFGQENPEKDNEKEVFRVVKYDLAFHRIASVAVESCYTAVPFDASSCRMAEWNNHLVIHTGRKGYNGHQYNITIVVDTDTLQVEGVFNLVGGSSVSHSFNQFVLFDGDVPVFLDLGDGDPRGVVLCYAPVYVPKATLHVRTMLMDIPGTDGYNWTGVSLGGFEQSEDFYLAVASTVRQDAVEYNGIIGDSHTDGHTLDSIERDVVLLSCPKNMTRRYGMRGRYYVADTFVYYNLSYGTVNQDYLTDYYRTGTSAETVYMVQAGEDLYAILWQECVRQADGEFHYTGVRCALADGSGILKTEPVFLPDARLPKYGQPIADGDSVVWYVDQMAHEGARWNRAYNRVFYRLSLSELLNPSAPDPADPAEISYVTVLGTSARVWIQGTPPADSILAVTVYREDGSLLCAAAAEADAWETKIPLNITRDGFEGGRLLVKACLLDSGFRPLCAPKQIELLPYPA